MKLSKAFRKSAEIISEPGKWQKGYYGYGGVRGLGIDDEGRYCMLGGVRKVLEQPSWPDGSADPEDLAFQNSEIVDFNDDPETTQEDAVMASLILAEFLEEGL